MDSVVPSYLRTDDVVFPLHVAGPYVRVSHEPSELRPLQFAMDTLVNGEFREKPLSDIEREGYHVRELSMLPLDPSHARAYAVDMLHWRRLKGEWPVPEASFLIFAGMLRQDLVIPRAVAVELVRALRAIRDGIAQGAIASRLSDEPVPPPRPLTPELEEFEFLWGIDKEDARRFAEELYERRG